MELAKDEAIAKFREHWDWLAEHPEKEKWEAPMVEDRAVFLYCFLGHFTREDNDCLPDCSKCPIEWPSKLDEFMCEHVNGKNDEEGLWLQWHDAHKEKKYKLATTLARQIANLPEREVQHDRP